MASNKESKSLGAPFPDLLAGPGGICGRGSTLAMTSYIETYTYIYTHIYIIHKII
jgi:hypothetical protein